ncbi:hypothetical protein [Paenibacillus ottowii]|uniref:Uncharacterized protein n=1 Tax=Paenibacillus ottowii TaxID=2315729 RepID=A0ABY3BAN7_9BACL|nr:hypothetical protein [Paenibacillus ottowii]TQS01360.1 hypothetical protein FKV70_03235 [Paenibacillus ottowii]TQS01415.1 hypothetical protein FKV70_03525 [Paenibacillus ottowii]
MPDFYLHHIQPIDNRTNHIILGRRSTGRFTAVAVRLRWWDRLLGRSLFDKTIAKAARTQRVCDIVNKHGRERDNA